VDLRVEGLEHIPEAGPTLIAAYHFHHFYDGSILLCTIPRPLHILVALDWIRLRWFRSLMEWACRKADWPIILRAECLNEPGLGAYALHEARSYLRHAVEDTVRLLRNGKLLIVFPEGYPNIDPTYTSKSVSRPFLPFKPGFARFVEIAERDGKTEVAVVPVGWTYISGKRWQVALRFGPALVRRSFTTSEQFIYAIEQQVAILSQQTSNSIGKHTSQEIFCL